MTDRQSIAKWLESMAEKYRKYKQDDHPLPTVLDALASGVIAELDREDVKEEGRK